MQTQVKLSKNVVGRPIYVIALSVIDKSFSDGGRSKVGTHDGQRVLFYHNTFIILSFYVYVKKSVDPLKGELMSNLEINVKIFS